MKPNLKSEAKSVVTRQTARASDVRPFAKIFFPDGKVKIVGNNPNDIDPENNSVTVYDIDGGGKEVINLSSGKFYVRDSLEDQIVDNLVESEKRFFKNLFSGNLTEQADEESKKKEEEEEKEAPKQEFYFDDESKSSEEDEEKDKDEDEEDKDESEPEFAIDFDDKDSSDLDLKDVPEEEREIINSINDAISKLIDYERKAHAKEGKEDREDESKVQERLLKRDISKFLGEEGEPKDSVEGGGDTKVDPSPNAKVGQPGVAKDKKDPALGPIEATEVTDPDSSDPASGKPKEGPISKQKDTPEVEEPDAEGLTLGDGPADHDQLAGDKVEAMIRRDIDTAISLVERGADPYKLAKRVLAGG